MNKIKEDILNKIKKGEIKKTSPWYFVTKDYFFKFLCFVSVILGAIGFSSALVQLFVKPEGHLEMSFSQDWFYYFIISAPYLWFLFLIIIVFIGWFNFKNTETGYKRNNKTIILSSIILSLILGAVLFATGAGKKFDDEFKHRVKPYREFQEKRFKHRRDYLEKRLERLSPERKKEVLERMIDRRLHD